MAATRFLSKKERTYHNTLSLICSPIKIQICKENRKSRKNCNTYARVMIIKSKCELYTTEELKKVKVYLIKWKSDRKKKPHQIIHVVYEFFQ